MMILGLVSCNQAEKQCQSDKTYILNQLEYNQKEQATIVNEISALSKENININSELVNSRGERRERLLKALELNKNVIDEKEKEAATLRTEAKTLEDKLNKLNC